MGVPKFYRWLSERYPLVNQAIDDQTLLPEFDALYLDSNGIIHNATHGNEGACYAPSLRLQYKHVGSDRPMFRPPCPPPPPSPPTEFRRV